MRGHIKMPGVAAIGFEAARTQGKPGRASLFRIAASANAKVSEYLQSRRRQLKNVPDAHFFGQCLLKFLLERRNFTAFPIFCDLTICTTRYSHRYALPGFLCCVLACFSKG